LTNKSTVIEVAQQILKYLSEHPDAKDTDGGILMYWLPKDSILTGPDTVREALDHLVDRGWLWKREGVAEAIYGLNKSHGECLEHFESKFR
jgi:hypothetical protein